MPAHRPRSVRDDHHRGLLDLLCGPHHGIAANSELRVVSRETARTSGAGKAHENVSSVPTETAREREKRIIGANIKRYREARGWTQAELATATRVDRTQVLRWEHGVFKPDPEHMERLGKMLGVTARRLLPRGGRGVSDQTLLVLLAGVMLLAFVLGGLIAIAAVIVSSRSQRNESGLGDEDVASLLGYPMYPLWEAKNGHKDDEGAAA